MRGKTPVVIAALAVFALTWAGSANPVQRPQAVPREQDQPKIEGALVEGTSITTDNGKWTNSPTNYRYRWQRCTANSASSCTDIPGADGVAYTLRDEDVGRRMRIFVTACNNDGCTSANSRITAVVQARFAPKNTRAPSVSGSAVVGQVLTGDAGAWDNGVIQFVLHWQRCNSGGGSCSNISGARNARYTLTSADLNSRLRFFVEARNNKGSATAVSGATDVVKEAGPAGAIKLPSGETSVPVASVALPQRLIISSVKFEPSVVRSRTEPLVGRFRVTDTRGFAVRDALVYAIGVPPNRVSLPGEAVTGQDGWATITYGILPRQPIARGAQITFFVRARKPGEDLLAGVSTRRLVSLRVSP
jgi:hypothetical protein